MQISKLFFKNRKQNRLKKREYCSKYFIENKTCVWGRLYGTVTALWTSDWELAALSNMVLQKNRKNHGKTGMPKFDFTMFPFFQSISVIGL